MRRTLSYVTLAELPDQAHGKTFHRDPMRDPTPCITANALRTNEESAPGHDLLRTAAEASLTPTDQRFTTVGLTAKLTAYQPDKCAQPQTHKDVLKTLTSTNASN
jgi:hypothetical protein